MGDRAVLQGVETEPEGEDVYRDERERASDPDLDSPCFHACAQVASSSVTGSMVLLEHGDDVAAEPLHLPAFASLAGRTVRNASGGSEAGTAQSEYAVTWTAGFVFKGQPFGGPGFKSVQIGLPNRCKHRRPFSIPGYFGQQWTAVILNIFYKCE